ncbi:hypothetical protein [Vibrio sp.]|uniref:hypothetical protein n=1 Tax=Vibrio sp. TaxID=678 RepID=UPI00311FDD44
MSLFSDAINRCIEALKSSDYPERDFIYEDEVIWHLRLGRPQLFLIDVVLHGEKPETLMKLVSGEIELVSYKEVICINNIGVREPFQKQGFFSKFMNELENQFPQHHLCISDINSGRIQQWVAHRDHWQETPVLLNTSYKKKITYKLLDTMRKHHAVKLAES